MSTPFGHIQNLDEIKAAFNVSINAATSKFKTNLDYYTDTLITRMESVTYGEKLGMFSLTPPIPVSFVQIPSIPINPTTTDTFDYCVTTFPLLIGDSKSGLYGDFFKEVGKATDTASNAINTYAKTLTFTSNKQVDEFQAKVKVLSTYLSSTVNTASTNVGNYVSSANNKFISAFESIKYKAAEYHLRSNTESFLNTVKRADDYVISSINSVRKIYDTYKILPTNFYTDVTLILTEIATKYNDIITGGFDAYNLAISSYKYYPSSFGTNITASQSQVESAAKKSSDDTLKIFSELPSSLTNKLDSVFSSAIIPISSRLFIKSINIRNQLENFVDDLSKQAESAIKATDSYFKNSYIPKYVDGADYRNKKAEVVNGASVIVSDASKHISDAYNDKVRVINSDYSNYVNDLQTNLVDFINTNSPGLTQEQYTSIGNKLSIMLSTSTGTASVYFDIYSAKLSNILDGIIVHLNKLIEKYYSLPPLLRFTGKIVSPYNISKNNTFVVNDTTAYNNEFSFELQNIGKTNWAGWFGIKLTAVVDESELNDSDLIDYSSPTFIWNRQLGFDYIPPGITKMFKVIIPGSLIYNLEDLGSSVIPTVIVNTSRGVSQS